MATRPYHRLGTHIRTRDQRFPRSSCREPQGLTRLQRRCEGSGGAGGVERIRQIRSLAEGAEGLSDFGKPIVATSANISNAPIIYKDDEALENLFSINSSSEYSLDISASEGIIDLVIITNISETVLVGLSIPENYPPGIYEGVINVVGISGISFVFVKS